MSTSFARFTVSRTRARRARVRYSSGFESVRRRKSTRSRVGVVECTIFSFRRLMRMRMLMRMLIECGS